MKTLTEINQELETKVGEKFNYKGKNVVFNSFKIVNTTFVIFLSDRPYNFFRSEIDLFLSELKPSIAPGENFIPQAIEIPAQEFVSFNPTKENATIKETLLDTLSKLKTDKEYIAQAKAICDVVSVMVSVQREEIKMIQILRD